MADIAAIKDYLKKIQRTVNLDADFTFFGKRYVKKNKLDTLICCVLAKLPDEYKKKMTRGDAKRFSSMVSLNLLQGVLTKKFWLNSDVYEVDLSKANKLITTFSSTVQRDINTIEAG